MSRLFYLHMSGKFDMVYDLAYTAGMMMPTRPDRIERSYREKLAWVSLISTLVIYLPFFVFSARWMSLGWSPLVILGALMVAVVVQAVVLPLGLGAWGLLGQREGEQPADERDRAIDARATRAAYVVLVTAGFTLPFAVLNVWPLFDRASTLLLGFFGCFVLAEVVRFSLQVSGYRRGF